MYRLLPPLLSRLATYPSPRTISTLPRLLDSPTSRNPLPASTPSTRHSLPYPGGDESRPQRLKDHHRILKAWRELPLPSQAILHPGDIVPSPHTTFIGVGLATNWPAVHAALEHSIFLTSQIAVVRDIFDRHESRVSLSDVLAFVADDIVAVLQSVVRPSADTRRFVNVYHSHPYKLVRNDVHLIEYLHSSGLRVVPVATTSELHAMRDGRIPIPIQQSTNHVLACAPTAFQFNTSAAADNHFMNKEAPHNNEKSLRRAVLSEFSGLHERLVERETGVGAQVHLFTHEDWHNTPDACFPNNTFSTHTNLETGGSCTLVLYPMKDETRRKERRLVKRLLTRGRYTHVYDMTREERSSRPRFLEGTGSLVLDRVNRIAYVAISQRSDVSLAEAWAHVMKYRVVAFQATDRSGRAIYHTNVMMSIGTRVAVVCSECIADEREREQVLGNLKETGHKIVDIGYDQVEMFCGNVLELESFYGEQVMVMSTRAFHGFSEDQREKLLACVERLVHADISMIERVGGGGVRCTIAELH